jgi:preprotein translocase subunit SecE
MAQNTNKEANEAPARRTSPIQFLQEVRREATKVTWPTWKETWLTTVMVFIMVVLVMTFFAFVDYFLGIGVRLLLGVG